MFDRVQGNFVVKVEVTRSRFNDIFANIASQNRKPNPLDAMLLTCRMPRLCWNPVAPLPLECRDGGCGGNSRFRPDVFHHHLLHHGLQLCASRLDHVYRQGEGHQVQAPTGVGDDHTLKANSYDDVPTVCKISYVWTVSVLSETAVASP